MRPTTAIFFVVSIILAVCIIAFVAVTLNSTFSGSNPTISPTLTPTPTLTDPPKSTPAANISYKYPLIFTYDYLKEDLDNGRTVVGYIIIADYHKDTPITINYSDFYLKLSVRSGMNTTDVGTVRPQNNGTFILDPSHNHEVFDLSFQFPTINLNGDEQAKIQLRLQYSGQAKLFG